MLVRLREGDWRVEVLCVCMAFLVWLDVFSLRFVSFRLCFSDDDVTVRCRASVSKRNRHEDAEM